MPYDVNIFAAEQSDLNFEAEQKWCLRPAGGSTS